MNETEWTKSIIGSTYFRYEDGLKYVRFPEVVIAGVVIPELIIVEAGR